MQHCNQHSHKYLTRTPVTQNNIKTFNKQLTTNYKANRDYFKEEEEYLLANWITRKSNWTKSI